MKKKTRQIVDLAIQVHHRVKLKEYDKRDRYVDLARESKNNETWKWRWYQL